MVPRTTLKAAAARPGRARVNSLESCEVSFSQGFSPFPSSSQVPGPAQDPRGPGYLGRPPQLSPAWGPPNRPLKESVQAYRLLLLFHRHLSCQAPPFCRRFWRRSSRDSFGSSREYTDDCFFCLTVRSRYISNSFHPDYKSTTLLDIWKL